MTARIKTMKKTLIWLLPFLIIFASVHSAFAGGMKGNLEPDELSFIKNEFIPILIKHNLCVRAGADCLDFFITCASHETLACDVHGVSDPAAVKEIMSAVLNSSLRISSFQIWKSKYHEEAWFEKPVIVYKNNMAGHP